MKKKITYIYELDNSRWKDFLLSFINKLLIILFSFGIFFSIFYPIGVNRFSEDKKILNESREIVLNIGLESKLMHSDDKKEQVYSLTSSYKYYLRTLLRYSYEHSDYDLNLDPDNYKSKQEEMSLFPEIIDFNDDFLGYFYVTYALNKNIVDYDETEPQSYFLNNVLKINNASEGGQFFVSSTNYPVLIPSIRTSLFSYEVNKNNSSNNASIDSKFFSYFVKLYEEAGNSLLKYAPYKEAYDTYNRIYEKINNFNTLSIYVSFFSSLIIICLVVPLLNKHKQNPAQLILKRVDLSDNLKVKPRIYLTRMIYDLFRNVPSIIFLAFVVSQNVLFEGLFYLGAFPISLFLIAIILSLLNVISLMLGLVRRDYKNLCMILSNSDHYLIKKVTDEEVQ